MRLNVFIFYPSPTSNLHFTFSSVLRHLCRLFSLPHVRGPSSLLPLPLTLTLGTWVCGMRTTTSFTLHSPSLLCHSHLTITIHPSTCSRPPRSYILVKATPASATVYFPFTRLPIHLCPVIPPWFAPSTCEHHCGLSPRSFIIASPSIVIHLSRVT